MTDEAKQPEKPTAPIAREELNAGLLGRLVDSVRDMKAILQETRDETASQLKELRADVTSLVESDKVLIERVARAERRGDEFEEWRARASMRVQGEVKSNDDQDKRLDLLAAKLVAVEAKTDSVEKKTDAQTLILTRLDAVASNPLVKDILRALGTGAVFWLASKGIHVQ